MSLDFTQESSSIMRSKTLSLKGRLGLENLSRFAFSTDHFQKITIDEELKLKIWSSFRAIQHLISDGVPIYGVTTGFGDSSTNYVHQDHSAKLQFNLIEYLSCGQGAEIPVEASRAMFLIRLNSLSQGYSGVSLELIERMCLLLENNIIPVVPREGSLGASGDLVPLAYLGQVIQGHGEVYYRGQKFQTDDVLRTLGIPKYNLKPKEGLAIVNGTSTMAGLMLYNLKLMNFIVELCEVTTAWQCLVLGGRKEAFGTLVNEITKTNPGQKKAAESIRNMLDQENYSPARGQEIRVDSGHTSEFIQDPYSLRCVPQILGPIIENLEHSWASLEHEINSVTDNPVVDSDGRLEMGGNFYGGYLSQAMDFTKINLANIVDLVDRQVLMVVSEKFNRGLPANLIDKKSIPISEQHIHHGLKGVHQTVSAITSEIIQKSIPSGIFSRSSESHNQDKVSLGMSAATTCLDMMDGVFKVLAMQLVCLAQALDLKDIKLKGSKSLRVYELVRENVGFVDKDRSLGKEISTLANVLKDGALRRS